MDHKLIQIFTQFVGCAHPRYHNLVILFLGPDNLVPILEYIDAYIRPVCTNNRICGLLPHQLPFDYLHEFLNYQKNYVNKEAGDLIDYLSTWTIDNGII